MLNFNVQLNDTASIVEIALKEMLQKQGNDLMSAPIRHAVLNGGKRLRAFLVFILVIYLKFKKTLLFKLQ